MTRPSKLAFGVAVLVLASIGATVVATSGTPAQQVVGKAMGEIIAILNDSSSAEDARRDKIADIAYQNFDFDTMSKLVIARPWRKFTEQERTDFIAAFKTHLARSYGRRLSRYEGVDVQVVGEVPELRGDVTVQSKVVGGQFDGATMNYRMRGKSDEWRVIDVVIEGVSLVSNFRSQFKPIVAEGGAAELLRRLTDKNDVLQTEIAQEEKS